MFGEFAVRRIKPEGFGEIVHFSVDPERTSDLVILCYGGMAELALGASLELLIEEEVDAVICVADVKPSPLKALLTLVEGAGRILIVEEGVSVGGWARDLAL